MNRLRGVERSAGRSQGTSELFRAVAVQELPPSFSRQLRRAQAEREAGLGVVAASQVLVQRAPAQPGADASGEALPWAGLPIRLLG